MALINGRQYQWSDITLMLAGRAVTGVRGIKYTESQEKEAIYGKGDTPLSIQRGNKSYSGEITLLQSEVETLRLLAKTTSGRASVMELSIDATVCYGNPTKGDVMVTDRIFGIQFTEDAKEMKQGDMNMEITLPFVCLQIDYNVD